MERKKSIILILAMLFGIAFVLVSLDKGWVHDGVIPESTKYVSKEYSTHGGSAQAKLTTTMGSIAGPPQYDRMVVAEAFLTLEVENFQDAYAEVYVLIEKFGGFIADSRLYETDSGTKRGTIVIRIPEGKFIQAVKEAEGIGYPKSKRITGRDVTEEFVDLGARLRNLGTQEGRLLDLLSKASNVDEILKVERELERIRGKIEQIKGRMQYLEDRAAMATVTLDLYEPEPIKLTTSVWKIREAVRKAANSFVETTSAIILAAGTVLPIVIIASLGFIAIRYYKGKTRKAPGLKDGAPPG